MDISDNRLQYLLLVFFLVVGITSGTFTVSHMQPGEKTALTGYMDMLLIAIKTQSVDYLTVLLHAFLQDTLLFGAITFFSLLMLGIPVIPIILIAKGFCVGFTIGVISLNLGFTGVAAIFFCVFIPNIVLIPCICKAGVAGINNSLLAVKNRRVPNTTKGRLILFKPHILKMLVIYLISLIGVILESLLTPALIKLL